MILYTRLWETMKKKKVSQYKLINQYHMSGGQLDRLRKNEHVSTYTLNRLCEILSCDIEDIVEYLPDEPEDEDRYLFSPLWLVGKMKQEDQHESL